MIKSNEYQVSGRSSSRFRSPPAVRPRGTYDGRTATTGLAVR